VLLWAQTVAGPVERDFTHVGRPSATAAPPAATAAAPARREPAAAATTSAAVDGRTAAAGTPSAFLSSKPAAYRCRVSATRRKTVPHDGQQRFGHRRGRASAAAHGVRGR